jgi:NADP-reducing hydrogenase subunit HndB
LTLHSAAIGIAHRCIAKNSASGCGVRGRVMHPLATPREYIDIKTEIKEKQYMPKLTTTELQELRKKTLTAMNERKKVPSIQILVGMGTCGIAAGARATFAAFTQELKNNGIEQAEVKQTGCIGQCYSEPTVEVRVAGMPDIIYGNVDPDTAKLIVRKHLIEKTLVTGHLFDKPSPDIITE